MDQPNCASMKMRKFPLSFIKKKLGLVSKNKEASSEKNLSFKLAVTQLVESV
jgi:hypothetical protein